MKTVCMGVCIFFVWFTHANYKNKDTIRIYVKCFLLLHFIWHNIWSTQTYFYDHFIIQIINHHRFDSGDWVNVRYCKEMIINSSSSINHRESMDENYIRSIGGKGYNKTKHISPVCGICDIYRYGFGNIYSTGDAKRMFTWPDLKGYDTKTHILKHRQQWTHLQPQEYKVAGYKWPLVKYIFWLRRSATAFFSGAFYLDHWRKKDRYVPSDAPYALYCYNFDNSYAHQLSRL